MANIALLVPFPDMLRTAEAVVEKNHFQIAILKQIETWQAVEEARKAAEQGVNIIVARGRQAQLIKRYTNLPLVEIRFFPQEIGLMIQKAKKLSMSEHPHIGLVVYKNMLCDMSYIAELGEVRLSVRYLEEAIDAAAQIRELKEQGVDVVIGGEVACQAADDAGIPSILYESTEISIREALQTAERMAFAQETEKQNSAQFTALMDTSVSGILKINLEGTVMLMNRRMESLMGKNQSDVTGRSIFELFPQIEADAIRSVLGGTRDSYASSMDVRERPFVLIVSPIQYDSRISGAILTFHATETASASQGHNSVLDGYSAACTFDMLRSESHAMQEVFSLAKMYAISSRPVLIQAPWGTEYTQLAEAIHNNSGKKNGPFVRVSLKGLDARQQADIILGGRTDPAGESERLHSALIRAHLGTLLLIGAEELSPWLQHELYRLFLTPEEDRTEAPDIEHPDVRVIAVAHGPLTCPPFHPGLFYRMQSLTLTLPPLAKRPGDLIAYFQDDVQKYSRKYNRYFKLSETACQRLTELEWEGNQVQLEAFAERLVLTSRKRIIDETQILTLYESLYPAPAVPDAPAGNPAASHLPPEAARLQALMEQYHGNRGEIARALGISTTTLWRRLKKYGIS